MMGGGNAINLKLMGAGFDRISFTSCLVSYGRRLQAEGYC